MIWHFSITKRYACGDSLFVLTRHGTIQPLISEPCCTTRRPCKWQVTRSTSLVRPSFEVLQHVPYIFTKSHSKFWKIYRLIKSGARSSSVCGLDKERTCEFVARAAPQMTEKKAGKKADDWVRRRHLVSWAWTAARWRAPPHLVSW